MEDEHSERFESLRHFLGDKLFSVIEGAAGDNLAEILAEADMVRDSLAVQVNRRDRAYKLIDDLLPQMIDPKLWRDLALGDNLHLPASDQYGPLADRLTSKSGRVEATTRNKGSAYGRIHDKGQQEPSAFIRRQSDTVRAHIRRIAELEDQMQREKQHLAEAESGLKFYAAAMLLTEVRNAAAPVFAMGPAWTLLRAIAGDTGEEAKSSDRARDTQRIMVVLHALRDDEEFRRELKATLLNVCVHFMDAAAKRGKVGEPWDGPYDYNLVLAQLGWPTTADA